MSDTTVPRDPQPPTQGTIFRRRLEALRMELGVRCETCQFFDAQHVEGRCTLRMEWTPRSGWCNSWQEEVES